MTVKKTAKKTAKVNPKGFKNRGGTGFTLKVNNNKVHDILREECNLFGTSEMSGTNDPFACIDTYRAVIFFMWGIPLDHPISKDAKKGFDKALRRLEREEPELFLKHQERIAGLKK